MHKQQSFLSYAPTLTNVAVKVSEKALGMSESIDIIRKLINGTKDRAEQRALMVAARRIQDAMEKEMKL